MPGAIRREAGEYMVEDREGGKVALLIIAQWFAMPGYRQFQEEKEFFDVCVCACVRCGAV